MSKKKNILGLLVVLLMVMAAAITVNKSIFGNEINNTAKSGKTSISQSNDSISVESDGTIIIHTAGMKGMINGYAGPVPLEIRISEGRITEIKALPNKETPSFFDRASDLLPLWIGKTPTEALAMNVDGISGATYSSSAIINNVRVSLSHFDGIENSKASKVPIKIWLALAVTLAACIFPLFVKNRIYHYCQLTANVVILGFWCGQFLDYTLILKYTSNGFSWPVGLTAVAMLTAAFIYPLFGKPQHYCNHICPLGSAQQLMSQLCGYKIKISHKTLIALDWFRKILWATLMLLLWADCFTEWMDFELFTAFQFKSASTGIIIAACSFVALSAIVSRPYCRFVCPTGSLIKRSENMG